MYTYLEIAVYTLGISGQVLTLTKQSSESHHCRYCRKCHKL